MSIKCCYKPVNKKRTCPQGPALVRGRKPELCFLEFCFGDAVWIGASYIVYEFILASTYASFALGSFSRYRTSDYVLAVRTQDKRYHFWEVQDVILPSSELYESQPIYDDAIFEIWNTPNTTDITVPGFCVPILRVEAACAPSNEPDITLTPHKQLWARFCLSPSSGYGYPYGYNFLVKFSEEKPC